MATANENPSKKFVNFQEFIDYQIDVTRKNVRATDLMTATAGGLAIVFGYLLLFVVLDHWFVSGGFSQSARIWMLVLAVVFTGGWIAWRIARPFMLRVTRLFAARTLEDAQPNMRDSLFTLVDLKQAEREVSPHVLESLEKRAAVNLSKTDVEHAVDRRDLMRVSYALLAVVVLFCLYSVFSPKKISSSVWRALIPAADIEAPTKTVISNVEPGNTEVLARTQLEVSAFISGDIPEEVLLKFTTADRKLVDETVIMRETDDGLGKYVGIINGENGRGILQEFSYFIHAGDDQSETYQVTVQQAPSAQIDQIDITYPGYMNLPPRKQFIGDIDTWEGATVKLSASTNMPVKSATVRFSDTDDFSQKAEEIMMNVIDGTKLEVEWPPLKFRTDGTHPRFFWIDCRTEAGDADPAPVLHQLKLRRDVPPLVRMIDPTVNLSMPANGIVPILVEARDPDFQLRYLTLRIEKGGEPIFAQPLFDGHQSTVRKQFDLKLEPLRLKSDDQIQFWVEARDNKEPLGNRSNTPKITVTITEPVTPQQVEKQLQEDKQAQKEKLAERQQQDDDQSDSGDSTDDMQGEDGMQTGEDSDSGDETMSGGSSSSENSDDQNATQAEQSQDGMNQGTKTESKDGEGETGSKPGEDGSETGDDAGDGMGEEAPSEKFNNDGTEDDLVLEELLKKQQQEQQKQNSDTGNQDNMGDQNNDTGSEPNSKNSDTEKPDTEKQDADNKGNNSDENMSDEGMNSDDKSSNSTDNMNKDGMDGDDSNMQDAENNNNKGPMNSSDMPSDKNEDGLNNSEGGTPKDADGMSEDAKDGDAKNPSDMSSGMSEKGEPSKDDQNPNKGMGSDSKEPKDNTEPGNTDSEMSDSDNANSPDGNRDPGNTKPKPGDGDEKGMGKPADDPNTDSTPAKNKIEREDGTDPTVRPADRDPMDPDNKTADGNKGKTDPSDQGKDGMSSQNNDNKNPQNAKDGGSKNPQKTDSNSDPKNMSDNVNDEGMPKDGDTDSSNKPPSKTGDKPNAGDDDKKGNGDPATQQNDQPKDGGEEGGNKQNTDGMEGGMDKGPGDETGKPGDNQKAKDGQKGKPGDQEGKGQQGGNDKGGEQGGKSGMGEGQDGQDGMGMGEDGGGEGGGKSPTDPKNAKPGKPSTNRSGAGNGGTAKDGESGLAKGGQGNAEDGTQNGSGSGEGAGSDTGDAPNLEDKKKAANLVLQKLKDDIDRGDVDEELLEKLGWTEDDLKKFTDRLSKNLQEDAVDKTSPEELARKKQFEEMLRGIRLSGDQKVTREGANLESTDVDSFAPSQAPAPLQYRELEEAYKNSLSKQRKK